MLSRGGLESRSSCARRGIRAAMYTSAWLFVAAAFAAQASAFAPISPGVRLGQVCEDARPRGLRPRVICSCRFKHARRADISAPPARLDMGRVLTDVSPIFQHDSVGLQLRSGRFPVAPVRSSQDRLSLVGLDCSSPPLCSLSHARAPYGCPWQHSLSWLVNTCIYQCRLGNT